MLGGKIFDNPKDHEVLARVISYCMGNDQEGLVMDFFAGAASTVEAVLSLNQRDAGKRKVIAVQLPEPCDENSAARKAGFSNIAEISRERIRRVIERIKAEATLTEPAPANLGFKSFLLAPSNFKQWRGDGIEDADALAGQIEMFVKSEKDGAYVENILCELLLKFGQSLTIPIEKLVINDKCVYAIKERGIIFVLEQFSLEMIGPLLALKPRELVALESVFHDSDELKSNLDLQCRDVDVRFTCI
jgi:adenine-specific DNA-methyltransferase